MLKEGKNFAPNIYLMPYYESYLKGTSVQEITDRLCEIYEQCRVPVIKEDFTYSFEEMKPFIVYRLVSYEKNQKLLCKMPHIKYLDLAITFHCLVRDDEDGIGTIRITNEHLKMWNTTLSELNSLSKKNTARLFPPSIRSMDEVLKGLLRAEMENEEDCEEEKDFEENLYDNGTYSCSAAPIQNKMYILSNIKGINGASCMLYEDVLRKFADSIRSDFYILPSSIHEIILVPYQENMKKETLEEMVKDVNRTQVAQDEILSDRVYYYSREHNAIML
jgi:hypothetical protein